MATNINPQVNSQDDACKPLGNSLQVTKEQTLVFACKYCNRQLESHSRIKSHVLLYHLPEQTPCLFCPFRVKNYEDLKNHVMNKHRKKERDLGVLFSNFYLTQATFNTGKRICRVFFKSHSQLGENLNCKVLQQLTENPAEKFETEMSTENYQTKEDLLPTVNEGSPDNVTHSLIIPRLIQKCLGKGNLLSAITLCCLKLRIERESLYCDTCDSQLPAGNSTVVRNHITGHLHNMNHSSNNCEHNLKLEWTTTSECLLVEQVLNNLVKIIAINQKDQDLKEDLIRNQRNPKKDFQCGNCNFGTSDSSEYEKHYNEKHKEEELICFFCLKQCLDFKDLIEHMNDNHIREEEKGIWRCRIKRCSYFANTRDDLHCHFERFHKFCSKIICYNCLSDYADFQSILDHYSNKLRYKCSACNFKTKEKAGIKSHMTRDHKSSTLCNIISYLACIGLFEETEKILKEEEKNLPKFQPPTKKIKLSTLLSKNKDLKCLDTKTYLCSYCKLQTQLQEDVHRIKSHVLRSHVKKPLCCHVPGCCFSSVDYNSLTEHIRFHHDMSNLKIIDIPNLYVEEKCYKKFGYDVIELFISEKRFSRTLLEEQPDTSRNQNTIVTTDTDMVETSREHTLRSLPEMIGQEIKKRRITFSPSQNPSDLRKSTGYLCCFCLERIPLIDLKSHISEHLKYKKYYCVVCKKCLFYKNGTKEFTKHALNHDLDPKDCYESKPNKNMELTIKEIIVKIKSRLQLSEVERHCLACDVLLPGGEEAVSQHIKCFHKVELKVNLIKLKSQEKFNSLLAANKISTCSLKKEAIDHSYILGV